MASGSDSPPIDTIAGVVADAVRRSLSDLGARPQPSGTTAMTPLSTSRPGMHLYSLTRLVTSLMFGQGFLL